jgi:hypothetical protein
MSARRAVLITLGVVTPVLALSVAAFVGHPAYDNARARADQWEELARQRSAELERQAAKLRREAAGPLSYERGWRRPREAATALL